MPLLLTQEHVPLQLAPEHDADCLSQPTAEPEPEPESCVPLSRTPEPVFQEFTQLCFNRLLPLISSTSGEHWSSGMLVCIAFSV